MAVIATIGKTKQLLLTELVEWFVKMVDERKQQHDCTKDKKNW